MLDSGRFQEFAMNRLTFPAGKKLPRSKSAFTIFGERGWRRRVPAGRQRRSWQRQNRLNWRCFIPALSPA
jgi:hypothetical protein